MLAVWMAGLVLLVGSFLAGARVLTKPDWVPPLLVIAAVSLVPLFLVLLFLMQTKFRPQLQEDAYYSKWLASEKKVFKDFAPENLLDGKPGPSPERPGLPEDPALSRVGDLEQVRVRRYEKYQGVFLVHSWRLSRQKGQVADIVLRLRQHGDGPLKAGLVDHVEYVLGPKFFRGPVVKRNREDDFRLEVSAYSPMLCVARVFLANGSSFEVERYADFDSGHLFPDVLSGVGGLPTKRELKGRLSDMG
jgi:hypothetical protein